MVWCEPLEVRLLSAVFILNMISRGVYIVILLSPIFLVRQPSANLLNLHGTLIPLVPSNVRANRSITVTEIEQHGLQHFSKPKKRHK